MKNSGDAEVFRLSTDDESRGGSVGAGQMDSASGAKREVFRDMLNIGRRIAQIREKIISEEAKRDSEAVADEEDLDIGEITMQMNAIVAANKVA